MHILQFKDVITLSEWNAVRQEAMRWMFPQTEKAYTPTITTVQVYSLRKLLNGMIIGPLDKNNGECSVVCPVLYKLAVEKVYPLDGKDYEHIQPKKLTTYQIKNKSGAAILQLIAPPPSAVSAAEAGGAFLPEGRPRAREKKSALAGIFLPCCVPYSSKLEKRRRS